MTPFGTIDIDRDICDTCGELKEHCDDCRQCEECSCDHWEEWKRERQRDDGLIRIQEES
jgi:hypothetical protein